MGRLKRRVALLVGCLVFSSACGGGDTPGDNDGGRNTSGGKAVGKVSKVLRAKLTLDGQRAGPGDPIGDGSEMQTDGTGIAAFRLGEKLDCRLQRNSNAQALSGDQVLKLSRGSIFCDSGLGSEKELKVDGGEAKASFRDPIFGIMRSSEKLQTQVFRGFVEMQPGRGHKWEPRLVGPDEQAISSKGRDLIRAPFRPGEIEREDREAVDAFSLKHPPPELGLPGVPGSPALDRIRRDKRIRFAFDPSAGPKSQAFINSLIGFLGEKWAARVDLSGRRYDRSLDDLREGRTDLVISPTRDPRARSTSLFGDESEKVWVLSVNGEDPKFQDAIRNFLTGALDVGEYGRRYLAAFGQLPSYEPVRPLIFPDPTGDPEPSVSPGLTAISTPAPTVTDRNVFQVTSVSLRAEPAEYTGSCPTRLTLTGEIKATGGPGTVRYRFLRSDGAADPEKTLTFSGPGSREVTNTWELGGPGLSYSGWQAIQILGPGQQFQSERANFTLNCADVFRITKTTLQASPTSHNGTCPTQFIFTGEISATGGRGTVRYRFLRSDGAVDTNEKTLTFTGPGSQEVRTTWTLGGPNTTNFSGWQAIEILDPAPRMESNHANFTLDCIQEPQYNLR